jgi:hypothetical protein
MFFFLFICNEKPIVNRRKENETRGRRSFHLHDTVKSPSSPSKSEMFGHALKHEDACLCLPKSKKRRRRRRISEKKEEIGIDGP